MGLRVGFDLLSESGRPGGIRTYVEELLRELLVADGVEELVVFAHADYRLADEIRSSGRCRVVRTRLAGLPAPGRRAAQHALLPRLARAAGVDVVHSVNNVVPGRLPVPSVVTVHDLSPFSVPWRFGFWKRHYLRSGVRASVRRATRVICVSRATRENILRWIPDASPERLAVVHNGVGRRFTHEPEPTRDREVRARHDLPESFLLHVSRIEPGKNLSGVLRALGALASRGTRPPLVVVGATTPHVEELRRLARALGLDGAVRYLGMVPGEDLPSLYRLARGFVFPSHHEGFGIPLLEALASGTPSVTSSVSSLPEVAGRAALTVEPDDPNALATAIERIWSDPVVRALLATRGPERARGFRWAEAARATVEVYREACATSRIEAAKSAERPLACGAR